MARERSSATTCCSNGWSVPLWLRLPPYTPPHAAQQPVRQRSSEFLLRYDYDMLKRQPVRQRASEFLLRDECDMRNRQDHGYQQLPFLACPPEQIGRTVGPAVRQHAMDHRILVGIDRQVASEGAPIGRRNTLDDVIRERIRAV